MVNFIIRDGDKFVLNGNELMRTENPVLEVPDIVGSEEVTEKIAEDVQVGDLLFKSIATVDRDKKTPPSHIPTGAKFIIRDGELYCYCDTNNIRGRYIYKYENGVWNHISGTFVGQDINYNANNTPSVFNFEALGTSDDKVILCNLTPSPRRHGFEVEEHIGNSFIKYALPDVSGWTNVEGYNGTPPTQNRVHYKASLCEASSIIHLAVGYEADYTIPDASGGISTYRVDTETRKVIAVPIDSSAVGDRVYSVDILEYDNAVYLAAGFITIAPWTTEHVAIFKYNPTSDRWDFHHHAEFQNSQINDLHLYTSGNEFWLAATRGTSPYTTIWKWNDSIEEFETYFDFGSLAASAQSLNYGRSIMMYDYSGVQYIINPNSVQADDPFGTGIYLAKHDPATSSFSPILSGIYGTRMSTATNVYYVDVVEYENELHLVLSYTYGDQLTFLKWNPANERFERNCNWANLTSYGRLHFIEHYDYSGTTYVMQGDSGGNERLKFGTVITSGDLSGAYEAMTRPDVGVNNESYDGIFYELSGNLHAIEVNRGSPYMHRFELDVSANQFKKLADPSALPPGSTYEIATEELSGTRYIATAHFNSPYVTTYYLDGSTLVKIPDPSSLPNGNAISVDLKTHEGDLHMLVRSAVNYTMPFAYKWTGSAWQDISVSGTYYGDQNNNRLGQSRAGRFYTLSGDLYMLDAHTGTPTLFAFKYYDSSGWIQDIDESPLHINTLAYKLDKVEHEGDLYFIVGGTDSVEYGTTNSVFKRSSNGKWEHIPIQTFSDTNQDRLANAYSLNGKLFLYSMRSGSMIRTQKWKLSDYVGEEVWYTERDISRPAHATFATGIALESGSKGDTIKIRKVKR